MKVVPKFKDGTTEEAKKDILEDIEKIVSQGIKYNNNDLKRVTWISEAIQSRKFESLDSFTVSN